MIPFEKMKPKMMGKEDRLSFKLRSNPKQKDSITYEIQTYAFDEGPPEEWIEHIRTFRKLVKGQNVTTADSQFVMLKRLLQGKALLDFEQFFDEMSEEDQGTLKAVEIMLRQITKELFPERALQKQKRAMRCYVRKPKDMTTSAFYARLVELNNFLTYFPTATHDSKLSKEELIEILEFALPNTWQMHMTLGCFVCSEKTSREILNHCFHI